MALNINQKKKELLNTSIYLFSNKGYSHTSVQDIATYCNISKATIYKLFNSKEEILVEIIKQLNNQMIKLLSDVDVNFKPSSKEKFIEKITILLTQFANKKDFAITLIQNEDLFKNNIVEEVFIESKLLLLNTLKNSCFEYFGNEIENIIWDLTYTLRGLFKEFSYIFITKKVIEKDFREVSEYIVNSITYIKNQHINNKPLIPVESVKFLCSNCNFQFDKEFLLNEWDNQINEIRHIISNTFSLVENSKLLGSLDFLENEFKSEDKKDFLIDSLILYLSKFEAISANVHYLKKIWIKIN